MRSPRQPPANPGGSSQATLYDEPDGQAIGRMQPRADMRGVVAAFIDQNATFLHDWFPYGSTGAARTAFSGAIAANTFFTADRVLLPGRNRFRITTGTAPTVFEVSFHTSDQL